MTDTDQPSDSASKPVLTARELAYQVLEQYRDSYQFVSALCEELSRDKTISPEDYRLAVELTHGIVRRKLTLEAVILAHVNRPKENIEPGLWTLLELGVYQLVFLDQVPHHAAVHETVELCKKNGQSRSAGFINGVLRGVTRSLTSDYTESPGQDTVPISPQRYLKLKLNVFPDQESQPAEFFSSAFSFPKWLIKRWRTRFNDTELLDLCFWFNAAPATWLRVNRLKGKPDELARQLVDAGKTVETGPFPDSLFVERAGRIDLLPGFEEGLFCVQDLTAMHASVMLAPKPGETILDLCSAPGTKTTHIAELMNDTGTVIATDSKKERLAKVDENCQRLGLKCIETIPILPSGEDIPAGPFDAVLLDVPCSNTGVLGKRPEARWRLKPEDIVEFSQLQLRLLHTAIYELKPGGRLVYSTCSIEPEENQLVIADILKQHPSLKLVEEEAYDPGDPADGGYQALLVKQA